MGIGCGQVCMRCVNRMSEMMVNKTGGNGVRERQQRWRGGCEGAYGSWREVTHGNTAVGL